jgi:hypothetical protein
MKAIPPKQMAHDLLKAHGPIDKEGKSHALAIVRRYTKPEMLASDGSVIGKNVGANYWQTVEREMLATVGRKPRRPKTKEEQRVARAKKAYKRQLAMEDKRRKRSKKKHKKKGATYDNQAIPSQTPANGKGDSRAEGV